MLQGGGLIHWHELTATALHEESEGHPAPLEAAAAVLPDNSQHCAVYPCLHLLCLCVLPTPLLFACHSHQWALDAYQVL
jgi:hypothetical protein